MKICKKCGRPKELEEFFKAPNTKSGREGKCKKCKIESGNECRRQRFADPVYRNKMRLKKREYMRKNPPKRPTAVSESQKRTYESRYPEKAQAKRSARWIKRCPGCEIHHWSYSADYFLDIIHLRKPLHHMAHRFLTYDAKELKYRTPAGELLNTKADHYSFILKIFRGKCK